MDLDGDKLPTSYQKMTTREALFLIMSRILPRLEPCLMSRGIFAKSMPTLQQFSGVSQGGHYQRTMSNRLAKKISKKISMRDFYTVYYQMSFASLFLTLNGRTGDFCSDSPFHNVNKPSQGAIVDRANDPDDTEAIVSKLTSILPSTAWGMKIAGAQHFHSIPLY